MTQATQSKYVRSAQGIAGYSPANHTGTSNQRLVSRDTVGAQYLEVLIGTIVKGHGASRHFHPPLEQAGFLLQGAGISEINGAETLALPGVWRHYRKGVPHRVTVTSDEPFTTIVVYAPPYAENREAVVVCEDDTSPGYATPAVPGTRDAIAKRPRLDSQTYPGVGVEPVISLEKSGAEHMDVFELTLAPGSGVSRQTLQGLEQVLFVQSGAVSGTIDGDTFEAVKGDFVFIPDNVDHAYAATSQAPAELSLIRAFPSSVKE